MPFANALTHYISASSINVRRSTVESVTPNGCCFDSINYISTTFGDQQFHTYHTYRNPTQVVNATATNGVSVHQSSTANSTTRSACPCVRSKSMEDVRTEVVSSSNTNTTTDWPTYIKDNFKNLNNGREVPQSASTAVSTLMSTATKHSNTRRSMDNLLKVDTNYGRPFQVCV